MIPAELLQEAGEIFERVKANMTGRSADVSEGGVNTRVFACLSVLRGDGDVLEIGCFFGASSITAALMRKAHNIAGNVVCLDPLDGRAQHPREMITGRIDEGTGLPWDAETLLNNAERNGVALELVQDGYTTLEEVNRVTAVD